MITLRIDGEPVPEPRPKIRTRLLGTLQQIKACRSLQELYRMISGQAYVPVRHPVHTWRAMVQQAWQASGGKLAAGPVAVLMTIVTSRPGRMFWKTKPMPREWDVRGGHGTSGDCDNFAKSILDSLNGLAWRDDNQVVRLVVEKVIASGYEQPHAVVGIRELARRPE